MRFFKTFRGLKGIKSITVIIKETDLSKDALQALFPANPIRLEPNPPFSIPKEASLTLLTAVLRDDLNRFSKE